MKYALLLPICLITTALFSAENLPITITNSLNNPVVVYYECLWGGREAGLGTAITSMESKQFPGMVKEVMLHEVNNLNPNLDQEPVLVTITKSHKSFVITKVGEGKIGLIPGQ